MNRKYSTRDLIVMSFMAAMGITCKPLLSPFFNLITDLIYIPGGSSVAGISIMFIVLGKRIVPARGSATMMAFVQGLLALCLGISSFQGLFILVSYTLPGIAIDIVLGSQLRHYVTPQLMSQLACATGVVVGSTVTNLGFLRLPVISLVLFYLVGILSGAVGGYLANTVAKHIAITTPQGRRSNNNEAD